MPLYGMHKIKTYVTRGKITESTHESMCVIKDYNNKIIFSTNNNKDLVYPRSAIKIFQAVPFIKSKAHEKFSLTKKQLAISCSSHCGETQHLKTLSDWIKKIKKNKNILKCGIHNPLNKKFSDRLLLSGQKPNELHNNCAGKHLGMISACMSYKMNINNYFEMNHPYQKLIRDSLEYFTKYKIKKINEGIDGCSAPQYAFPLVNLADSMINLLENFHGNKKYSDEIKILLNAISIYPQLTGSHSIYPTQLMSATNGVMFSKGGAEGVLLFAHKDKKIGGVIKVKDGNERALPSVANNIFKKLKILSKEQLNILSKWSNEKIINHAEIKVGEIYTKIK